MMTPTTTAVTKAAQMSILLYPLCIRFRAQIIAKCRNLSLVPALPSNPLKPRVSEASSLFLVEARAGIEPAHTGFADQC
ncbi:MAG: hypothetical protein ACOYOF_18390, partial [Verrucomicrobiaceae bacterium]